MKEVYPEYAEAVDFYAVGVHPGSVEDIATLERFRQEQGYPWPVAAGQGQLLADLNVTIQSTKIAFDAAGVITYREGMGRGSPAVWQDVFRELAELQ